MERQSVAAELTDTFTVILLMKLSRLQGYEVNLFLSTLNLDRLEALHAGASEVLVHLMATEASNAEGVKFMSHVNSVVLETQRLIQAKSK